MVSVLLNLRYFHHLVYIWVLKCRSWLIRLLLNNLQYLILRERYKVSQNSNFILNEILIFLLIVLKWSLFILIHSLNSLHCTRSHKISRVMLDWWLRTMIIILLIIFKILLLLHLWLVCLILNLAWSLWVISIGEF